MLKERVRNRTRCGSKNERRAASTEQYRAYRYVALVSEDPHPLMRVPGVKHCRWDAYIGRWVKIEW